jgi:glycosyltransferase involved in cell wall biosynthesis
VQRLKVLYLAAHGGYAGQAVPLGGGAAIANLLAAEWERTRPFDLELITPAILGSAAPSARQLVSFSESQYAAFCDAFRQAATREALRHDPASTAILVNDIAEGPDFERLARAGFRIVTVYHVDVVAYIASIYLRRWLRPQSLTRWWERLRGGPIGTLAPSILRLIFEQQRASLRWSERVVVPSGDMKSILQRCYPATPPERIEVLPWGCPSLPPYDAESERHAETLRAGYGLEPDAHVLLCLSRISPEKGQDFLLQTLLDWERSPSFPRQPVWLFLCGEAAFMHGRRYERRLRALAARLQRVRVVFPGYVTGARKQAFLRIAHVYLFPSSHESYGLTLVEALGAGLPAICRDHAGARQILRPEIGVRVEGSGRRARAAFQQALEGLLTDEPARAAMAAAAREWARQRPFAASAARLSTWLAGSA